MAPAENVRFGGQPQGILINQGFPLRDLGDLPGPDHGPEVGREEGQNVLQQVAASLAGPIPSPVRPGLVHLVRLRQAVLEHKAQGGGLVLRRREVRGRHDGDGLAVPQGQVDFVKRLDQRPRRPGHNGRFQLLPGAFIFDGVSDLHGGFLLLFHAPFGRRGRKYQYCYQDPPRRTGTVARCAAGTAFPVPRNTPGQSRIR